MADQPTKATILPFYVVIDVSFSMTQDDKLSSANTISRELKNALAEHPVIADKVRFGFIDFSDDARVVLPLGDLSLQDSDVVLEARGATSYAAAFRLLRTEIEKDVRQLRADDFAVVRPAVFFISDGEPTDSDGEWQQAFEELTQYDKATKIGFAYFPNVIPFGLGASPDTMKQLIHPPKRMRCYLMKDGANPGEALRQMAEILVASTLASGASASAGGSGIVLPDADDLPDDVFAADWEDDL